MKKQQKPGANQTYYISLVIILAIVVWAIASGSSFEAAGNLSFQFLATNFSWFYMPVMTAFVVFSVWIGFLSKYRHIRPGSDNSRPEYSNVSWFGMLFSAGMGIGLVFWGVAEPLSFWAAPPGLESGSTEAACFAFRKAFLHWGLHPWAGYCVLGLAMAYFQFRKGKPGLVSSVFTPLLGDKGIKGPVGKLVDILAVFATAAGIATSLGLGAMQINSGLNAIFGVPENKMVVLVIVVVITVIYTWTALAGVDKGIKWVCDMNIIVAFLLMACCLVVGPTLDILRNLVEGVGQYVQTFPGSALEMGAFSRDPDWYGKWTVFYWAWWIAWAPFTGGFVARVSKGRTIREFIAGVLLLPAGASFVWFAIFGTLGINVGEMIGVEAAAEIASNTSTALFSVLEYYPLATILSVVALVLLCTFFITSANSATFVLGMLSSEGDLNPSNRRKLMWGVLQAALALVLIICTSNGLNMLQTISIVASFPFAFILIFAMISMVKVLKTEEKPENQ